MGTQEESKKKSQKRRKEKNKEMVVFITFVLLYLQEFLQNVTAASFVSFLSLVI